MRKILLFALLFSGMIASAQIIPGYEACTAYFKYKVNTEIMSILPATAINFYDKSYGDAVAWYWDFGDGRTSQEQNPMIVFNHPMPSPNVKINPYRTVTLTILTADGCKSNYSETINIMDGTSAVISNCKAGFKYYLAAYDSIAGTVTFQLNNYSVGDSLGYDWNFEGGITSTEPEPKVTFDINPGHYMACLTVTGKNNCSDIFCETIYFENPNGPFIEPIECYTGFGYKINYDIKTFAPALVLDFYSKATPEAVLWEWDFGDGSTSYIQNPVHTFEFPIIQDKVLVDPNPFRKVCLKVTTAGGCVAQYCETINIYMNATPPDDPATDCHAWFKYETANDIISIPEVIPYRLHDVSNGNVVSRIWKFEDGTIRTEADPLVTFDFMKPTQQVSLTIFTADSCSSTWSETITVSDFKPDTVYINPAWGYTMRYESGFPLQMSSCAGWAKAQVYLNDSIVEAFNYSWSTGELGQEVKGLCPTQSYSVKAITPDGTVVSGSFVFNAVGPVTESPINWRVTGIKGNPYIQTIPVDKDYTVEWKLCDGTTFIGDSVPLNLINCGTQEPNFYIKNATGDVFYSESINMIVLATYLNAGKSETLLNVYPNPVKDVLYISYSGKSLNEMTVTIYDMNGRSVFDQKIHSVESGQNNGINVNFLKNGVYICKITCGDQTLGIQKFFK